MSVFASSYETALRRLAARHIATGHYAHNGSDPLDPAVPVIAEMDIDGWETSGYSAQITISVGRNVIATYYDLADLIGDLGEV